MCCDILLLNSLHYVRAAEVQKSLSRIQRIKNKVLRSLGKKKANKKERIQSTPDATSLGDVEMVEIEPNCT